MQDYSKDKIEYITKRATYIQPVYLLIEAFNKKDDKFPIFLGQLCNFSENFGEIYWIYKNLSDFDKYLDFYSQRMDSLEEAIREVIAETQGLIPKATENDIQVYFSDVARILRYSAILRCIDIALQKKFKDFLSDEEVGIACVFDEETLAGEEEGMLLKLKSENLGRDVEEAKLKEIYEAHKWLYYGLYNEKPASFDEYKKRFDDIAESKKKLHDLEEGKKADKEKRDALVARLSKEQKDLVMVAQKSAYLKDLNKVGMDSCFALSHACFEKMALKSEIEEENIRMLLPQEILEFLKGKKFNFNQIKERNKNMVFLSDEKRHDILQGNEAKSFQEKYLNRKTNTDLKGRVASRGFVKGIAKVVTKNADFHKMNQGDVLVVCNTTPDYVSVMKKAAAIVAEEGGITAHVSVVSREFRIPSIVGVANATEILKDGQMIEVDAEKGVVKII